MNPQVAAGGTGVTVNPTNLATPSQGQVFRSSSGGLYSLQNGTLYSASLGNIGGYAYQSSNNTTSNAGAGDLTQLGTAYLKNTLGIDVNNIPLIGDSQLADMLRNSGSTPIQNNVSVGNSSGSLTDPSLLKYFNPNPAATTQQQTINAQPSLPANQATIAASQAAQTQQLAGDQGQNVTQTTTPEGIAAIQKTPLGTPAAQTQTTSGVSTQTPSTAGAAAGAPINYAKSPTETIDQYNARIAASGGPVAPSSTSTGAASTVDTNYQMQPGETIDSYNARIAAYNAQKPTTTPTGETGASGTMADTNAATGTDPYAGLDPVAKQVAMYTEAYNSLGLNTIKQQFDDYTQQQSDLTNKMNDEIANTVNNPWLSQGVSDKTVQRIKDKYATQLDTLTNLLTLTDSLYKQGQAQVDTMVSAANADIKATNDLAQQQIDAANALAKDNEVVSTGGRELLVNKDTGKTVADLGPSNPPASANAAFNLAPGDTRFDANGNVIASLPAKPTQQSQADQTQEAINQVGQLFTPGATIPGSGGVPFLDSSGNATPEGWNAALSASGLPRATFIKDFGYLIENAGGTVSPKYGLSSVETRSITGALQ